MRRNRAILSLGAALVGGISAIPSLSRYCVKEAGLEVDLLRGTSAYLNTYSGESPKEAIEYAQETIKIAGKNEILREDISKLEKEIQDISKIEEFPSATIYEPILKSVGEKIDNILKDKARKESDLYLGVGLTMLALLNLGFGINNLVKD